MPINFPNSPTLNQTYSYNGLTWIWNGSAWDNTGQINTILYWKKTASGGETSLSGNDDNGVALSYTVGQELLYINGVLQVRGTDYTASTGTTITGLAALTANDIVTVWGATVNNISNAILATNFTAKGDHLSGTGAGTFATVAVGANDQILVADSTTASGVAWKSYAAQAPAGKNAVINGGMDIWQRGVGPTTVNNALTYVPDRWFLYNSTVSSPTVQRVTGTNTGTQYAARINGATSFGNSNFAQRIESNQIAPLAGSTVTFSGKIYGSTNISSVTTYAIYPTAQDNYSSTTNIAAATSSITVNTTLRTFSVTFTLPAGVTNGLEIGVNIGAGIANAQYIDISNLQLELGNTATPFARAGGNIAGELAACQRYYANSWEYPTNLINSGTGGNWVALNVGTATTGSLYTTISFPVNMRVAPTLTLYDVASPATSGKVFKGANGKTATTSYIGTRQALGGTDDATSASYLLFGWQASAEL